MLNYLLFQIKKDQISYDSAVKQIESQLPADMRAPMLESLNACKDVGKREKHCRSQFRTDLIYLGYFCFLILIFRKFSTKLTNDDKF